MAKEAILKIKEAENQSAEILKKASDEARDLLRDAQEKADAKKKANLDGIRKDRAALLEAAEATAKEQCRPIIDAGNAEIQAILHPSNDKVEAAVKLVIERIVNVSGNR